MCAQWFGLQPWKKETRCKEVQIACTVPSCAMCTQCHFFIQRCCAITNVYKCAEIGFACSKLTSPLVPNYEKFSPSGRCVFYSSASATPKARTHGWWLSACQVWSTCVHWYELQPLPIPFCIEWSRRIQSSQSSKTLKMYPKKITLKKHVRKISLENMWILKETEHVSYIAFLHRFFLLERLLQGCIFFLKKNLSSIYCYFFPFFVFSFFSHFKHVGVWSRNHPDTCRC